MFGNPSMFWSTDTREERRMPAALLVVAPHAGGTTCYCMLITWTPSNGSAQEGHGHYRYPRRFQLFSESPRCHCIFSKCGYNLWKQTLQEEPVYSRSLKLFWGIGTPSTSISGGAKLAAKQKKIKKNGSEPMQHAHVNLMLRGLQGCCLEVLLQISLLASFRVQWAVSLVSQRVCFTRLVHPPCARDDFLACSNHLQTNQNKLRLTRTNVQLSEVVRPILQI